MTFGCSSGFGGGVNGVASLVTLQASGALDTYLYDKKSGVTQWFQRFAKQSVSATEWTHQEVDANYGSTKTINLNRGCDALCSLSVGVTFPKLRVSATADGTSCGSYDGMKNSQNFVISNCDPTAAADLKFKIQYAKPTLVAKYNLGESFAPSELEEVNQAYARATCTFAPCAFAANTADCPCDESGFDREFAYYVDKAPVRFIEGIILQIGNAPIEQLDYTFLNVHSELYDMVGSRPWEARHYLNSVSEGVCKSMGDDLECYVAIPWNFSKSLGLALPFAALAFAQVQLKLTTAHFNDLVCVSSAKARVDNVEVKPSVVRLWKKEVYLGETERTLMQTKSFKQIITQVQAHKTSYTGASFTSPLSFNLAVHTFYVVVQREAMMKHNLWFDYTGFQGKEPVKSICLSFNNAVKAQGPGKLWRLVEPAFLSLNIPLSNIYTISMATHPADKNNQVNGSANLSKIDNTGLTVTMNNSDDYFISVYVQNLNVLQYQDGLCSLLYAA